MLAAVVNDTTLTPNAEFRKLASAERVQRIAKILEVNGMKTVIVENGEEAKKDCCTNRRTQTRETKLYVCHEICEDPRTYD